jgi:hypothetical protein
MSSRTSPESWPLDLIAPRSEFQPSATGGTCKRAASSSVMPRSPRRSRILSAIGEVPGGGYLPGIILERDMMVVAVQKDCKLLFSVCILRLAGEVTGYFERSEKMV